MILLVKYVFLINGNVNLKVFQVSVNVSLIVENANKDRSGTVTSASVSVNKVM